MRWEDTVMVMDKKQIGKLAEEYAEPHLNGICPSCARVVAKAQAEISFKAGIREVVDFIVGLAESYPDLPLCALVIDVVWQAKLKEWGITEVKND